MAPKPRRPPVLGAVWEEPAYCPDGVRHEGGASLAQALVWNVGKRRAKPPGCSEGRSRAVKVGEPYRPRAMGGLSRGRVPSVGRGTCRPGIEPRNFRN